MNRILVLGFVSGIAFGCSSGDSGNGPGGGDVQCTGTNPSFPTFDKGCASETDCVLVRHTTSCCPCGTETCFRPAALFVDDRRSGGVSYFVHLR
jgi:hypothetical protein